MFALGQLGPRGASSDLPGHSAPPATSTAHQLVAQSRKARNSFRKRSTDVEKGATHIFGVSPPLGLSQEEEQEEGLQKSPFIRAIHPDGTVALGRVVDKESAAFLSGLIYRFYLLRE